MIGRKFKHLKHVETYRFSAARRRVPDPSEEPCPALAPRAYPGPMKLRLLRFFAKRPLALVAMGLASLLGLLAIAGVVAIRPTERPRDDAPPDPRAIMNRGWYDRYPRKRTDEVKFLIFFGGGFGVYEEGSAFKVAYEVFELERQKDKMWFRFLQDGKTAESKFTISRCDEKSPFDLCLDIPDTPRGPKRFYGFDYGEDFAARIPWGPQMLRAAEAHARMRE